ncbi:DUF5908 family protein [Burkholderia stagnalis]|uniref:DUF5908 family protein n=1 Tax=Burkholderia stagnalis TaxID=1503054 RepID=UPI000AD4D882|nr:DUF5908 family protein [Burkholderia stagnalis]MDY7806685.1 DUF5908 family protein [Burkholderia stagnalis]
MTIEIRELVIEARVVSESRATRESTTGRPGPRVDDEARWLERVAQRVLTLLNEQRERL